MADRCHGQNEEGIQEIFIDIYQPALCLYLNILLFRLSEGQKTIADCFNRIVKQSRQRGNSGWLCFVCISL